MPRFITTGVFSPPNRASRGAQEANATASALLQFERQLGGISSNLNKIARFKQGQEAGTDATNLDELPELTEADRAFKRGALTSHSAALKIDISTNMTRLQNQYQNDPEGFQSAYQGYMDGMLEGMEPSLVPTFGPEMQSLGNAAWSKINSAFVTEQRETQSAEFGEALGTVRGEIMEMVHEEPQNQALPVKMQQYEALIRGAADMRLIDAADVPKMLTMFDNDIKSEAVLGDLNRAYDEGKHVDVINRFIKTRPLKNPERHTEVLKRMYATVRERTAVVAMRDKAGDDERADRYRNGKRAATLLALSNAGDKTGRIASITRMIEADDMDATLGRTLISSMNTGSTEFTDPAVFTDYRFNLLDTGAEDIVNDPRLKTSDKLKLLEKQQKERSDQFHWKAHPKGKQALSIVKAEFGIVGDFIIGSVGPEKAKQIRAALDELENSVDTFISATPNATQTDIALHAEDVAKSMVGLNVDNKTRKSITMTDARIKRLEEQGADDDLSDRQRQQVKGRLESARTRLDKLKAQQEAAANGQ